jgi:putative peptidoglycan lipid II flippase
MAESDGNSRTNLRNYLVLVLITLFNILTTFGENVVIAKIYGRSLPLDAFLVGRSLPDLLGNILGSAQYGLLIPLATEVLQRRGREAYGAFNRLFLGIGFLGFLVVAVLGAALSPWIVGRFLSVNAEQMGITLITMQVMFLAIPFTIFSFAGRGLLEIDGNFYAGSLPGIIRSLLIIVVLLLIGYRMGPLALLWATAAATVLGAITLLGFFIQGGTLAGRGMSLVEWGPRVTGMLLATLPIALINAIYLVYPFVDRMMVGLLDLGGVTSLFYAFQVMLIPHTLVNGALGTVIYPTLARLLSSDEQQGLRRLLVRSLRGTFIVGVTISAAFVLLREPIIEAIFQRGKFTVEDSAHTSVLLGWYGVGFVFLGPISIVTRMLMAMRATWHLFALGILAFLWKIGLNQMLAGYGASGFAIATSMTGGLLLLGEILCLLWMRPGLLAWRDFSGLLPFVSAVAMVTVALANTPMLSRALMPGAGAPVLTALVGFSGMAIMAAAWLPMLRMAEAQDLAAGVRAILGKVGMG